MASFSNSEKSKQNKKEVVHLGTIPPQGKRSQPIQFTAVYAEKYDDNAREVDKQIIRYLFGV